MFIWKKDYDAAILKAKNRGKDLGRTSMGSTKEADQTTISRLNDKIEILTSEIAAMQPLFERGEKALANQEKQSKARATRNRAAAKEAQRNAPLKSPRTGKRAKAKSRQS